MLKNTVLSALVFASLAWIKTGSALSTKSTAEIQGRSFNGLSSCSACYFTSMSYQDFSRADAMACFKEFADHIVVEYSKKCNPTCSVPGTRTLAPETVKMVRLSNGMNAYAEAGSFTNLPLNADQQHNGFSEKWGCTNGMLGEVSCAGCKLN
ncbi:hypothetical protein BCV69DRAFT_277955 [Microstroma glucosiphilum]|uniref:Uncharacterized protein n=1 Tax=Pseudomicrostroma glucosiphilum TaxID=1684307 RepID=A0A316U2U9_9BASI|nr:hypothetical protein BCV69DRAFT_277955 [Pseudomicrostroma glucosiphilum]PWN19642.1 hypothetical protein BCV69DRAFT_277955 [Pseudomicrostroma glucosiphilum]